MEIKKVWATENLVNLNLHNDVSLQWWWEASVSFRDKAVQWSKWRHAEAGWGHTYPCCLVSWGLKGLIEGRDEETDQRGESNKGRGTYAHLHLAHKLYCFVYLLIIFALCSP